MHQRGSRGQAFIKVADQVHNDNLGKLNTDEPHMHINHIFWFQQTIFEHDNHHLHNYMLDASTLASASGSYSVSFRTQL
jgi:hypothetical protein